MTVVVCALALATRPARAQDDVPPERLAAREWYRDAKFGMFIHWGVYSLLGNGEWVMENRNIAVPDYEWLASTFNPVAFDAREWVSLAKAAGMRYITITSRHHDGFSMFASRVTPYNIVDFTPFGRDPLAELAEECRRQGLELFFYYSQLDWRHPDYWPRGRTGHGTGRPESGEWVRYLDFIDAQLTELLTNYGPIGGIWFDGMWDKPDADWRLDRTYSLIHRLQPTALIIPNHHQTPLPGEDAQTFEQDLPGSNSAGFNTAEIGTLPLETSLTMNGSWGYDITDKRYKSVRELIGYLVRAAGHGANLLLNVGPRPDGTIAPAQVERLRAIGAWLDTYGPSIHETRAGPVPPRAWGATTQRGDTVFVHVLDWPDRTLSLPPLPKRVRTATHFSTGERVRVTQSDDGVTLTLPEAAADDFDRVIALVLEPARPERR
jgi:alpha-L-fucosidase